MQGKGIRRQWLVATAACSILIGLLAILLPLIGRPTASVALARPDPGLGMSPAPLVSPTTTLPPPAASPAAVAPAAPIPQPGGFLRTQGSKLVDQAGREVLLTGLSWFGMETNTFAPHGLWARNWHEMLDQIASLGWNTIRLPFSNQIFDPDSKPNGIDFNRNPDLAGLTGLQIMDRVIVGAGSRGLRVLLDRHRPDANGQSELWYTDRYPERRWLSDWQMLARRYAGNAAVIGADLHNEPHGRATWGTGDPSTDWRLAAERAGNAILAVNPDWLIIVEGVERDKDDYYWWGGNLKAAGEFPVRLERPGRLVYSPHDYGPGVYNQRWFQDPAFPANLPALWDSHWAYLKRADRAPILLGEFGGRSVGNDTEGIWQRTLVSFLKDNGISYIYWTLNANSGDTGGILNDDWLTINQAKQTLLSSYQAPLFGKLASR